ncbi:hypothetical protein OTU49_003897 [Cherax quadricarinatus]|uniref:Type-1 angiotensin II receptor-associated protein n=1 Tax=Cherax quadricarinatus TaxID=27406 RepID=A0AAW0X1T2_CHEQU|nr:type-1 angiotensin II receptor-associated protein-like [Cherax quadricarinatus]
MENIKNVLCFLRRVSSNGFSPQNRLDILFGTFFTHLTLTVWSSMCECLPQTFMLYNAVFLLTILWSLHQRESQEAPFMALCINALAMVFDTVHLALFWPLIMTGPMKFGGGMVVLNLMLRPFSSFLLFRIVQERAQARGTYHLPSGFERIFAGHKRGLYEDIDQTPRSEPVTLHSETAPISSTPHKQETFVV